MSLKEKAKKFGSWAADNADSLIIGAATVGLIGLTVYARKVVRDEEKQFESWMASEEEKGNRILPGPEGFFYIFGKDGNQTIAVR